MSKVSVIVPAYNAEKTIEKCINSLINQTFDDYEIIILNDGSIDGTKKILKRFENNKKIKIINKSNEGIGKTRNLGIRRASGEYIMFVDSDDYVDNQIIEKYYKFALENNLDLVTSTYKKVINNNIISWPGTKYDIGNLKTNPQILNYIEYGPCAKLYRRELIIKNNIFFIEDKKYEDFPFVCKAILKSNLIGYLNGAYYYYVINDNSETTTIDRRVFDILDILKIIKDDYKDEEYLKDEIDFLIIDKVTTYMLQQSKQKDLIVRKKFINDGYKFINTNVKNWKKNKYYVKTNIFKRIIKNNKNLLIIYCKLYNLFH